LGSVSGGRFKFVRTAATFQEPVIFEFVVKINNSNGFGFSSADVDLDRILFRQAGFGFDTLNQVAFIPDTISNGFQVEGMYPLIRFTRYRAANAFAGGVAGWYLFSPIAPGKRRRPDLQPSPGGHGLKGTY